MAPTLVAPWPRTPVGVRDPHRPIHYPVVVFSRKKSSDESPVQLAPGATGKKGRPTPSRREAEARHNRPLVPADRKEAKRVAKTKRDEAYRREQEALVTGDERYLPLRDKGRVRRFIRDWVDARWSASEFFVPFMLVFLAGMMAVSFIRTNTQLASQVLMWVTAAFYGLLVVSIIEGIVVWQRIKRRVKDRYPEDEIPRGSWFYTYSRMVMARRWRSPRPQVQRGAFPETTAHTKH